jgi:hypothetical protein
MGERPLVKPTKTFTGLDLGKPGGDKSMMVEVETLADGTQRIVSIGEVIEGELATPLSGRADRT